jgi:NAD(P)H-binding
MILVTTAGKVGTEAALLLRQRELPARVLVRDPGKAKTLAHAGVEIAVGDLDVPASIDAAMTEVTAVILVSPAVPAQELNVVASVARTGVGHVVKATMWPVAPGRFPMIRTPLARTMARRSVVTVLLTRPPPVQTRPCGRKGSRPRRASRKAERLARSPRRLAAWRRPPR